jgi:hypothetical protein
VFFFVYLCFHQRIVYFVGRESEVMDHGDSVQLLLSTWTSLNPGIFE